MQLRYLLEGRLGIDIRAKYAIDFLVGLRQHVRMLEHGVDRAGQQPARGFVARNQERVDLVADVDVVELVATDFINAGHHGVEHVFLGGSGLGVLASSGDDFVDHIVHERDVGGHVGGTAAHEQAFERQPALQHHGFK